MTPTIGAIRQTFAPWDDPAAKPLVRFEGVTKRFGASAAVDDVTMSIYEREFFALLGPSGCGKTTLMRMLAGFEAPDAGRVLLDGEDLAAMPPHRRPVNMMFQSYALFPHLTVEKNVAFGLKMAGMNKAQIAARVEEMLALVKLEGFAARMPGQLSGGQKQRVALARAIARKPRVLLLDEPLAALDKKLREETQFELTSLQVQLGITFLTVTHDQDEAMVLADRIGVMDKGRIVQVGPPAEIYEAPCSCLVAEFVGDINMFEATIEVSASSALRLTGPGGAFQIEAKDAPPKGSTVWLAVRPEKMRLSPAPFPKSTPNVLAGKILDTGYLGDWTTYRIETTTGQVLKAAQANVARAAAQPLSWGDQVHLAFAPDAAVVLTR